eukprot:jgi/Tetstr1/466823/TSEL_001019.t1
MGQAASTYVSKQWSRGKECREPQPKCVFCKTAADDTRVLYQDESVVVFPDRSPAAVAHLLVIPRDHIAHGYCLKPCAEDRRLVEHMVEVGVSVLRSQHPGAEYKTGFHMPPLYSVDHLHLHCFALPHTRKGWKYTDFTGSWPFVIGFISSANMIKRLGGAGDFPPHGQSPPGNGSQV